VLPFFAPIIAVIRYCRALPDGLVIYSARHTFGTQVLAASGDLAATMKVMGHRDVKTTMRYQHPQLDARFRAAVNGKVN
jgi:integrase